MENHITLHSCKKTEDKCGMGEIVRCKDREKITTMIMMIRGDRTDHVTTCNYDVITLLLKWISSDSQDPPEVPASSLHTSRPERNTFCGKTFTFHGRRLASAPRGWRDCLLCYCLRNGLSEVWLSFDCPQKQVKPLHTFIRHSRRIKSSDTALMQCKLTRNIIFR